MLISIVSIFPSIFESFLETSLIQKATVKKILKRNLVNPRDFCKDKHKQVDDEIYGWWAGMLMKAKPLIDAVESIINKKTSSSRVTSNTSQKKFLIVFVTPSQEVFTQKVAHKLANLDHIIFVCGRYEGVDYRFEQYMKKKYPKQFTKLSIGPFITLGGETPAMTMIEAITRLIPWVIKESESRENESYNAKQNMTNLEHPHYTRPEELLGMKVPTELLSGNHANIKQRKEKNSITIQPKNKK